MVDSITLLANHTTDGRRTPILKYEFDDRQLRATELTSTEDPEDKLLRLELYLGERGGYVDAIVDIWAQLLAKQQGLTRELIDGYLTEDLSRQGIRVRKGASLKADHVQNGRRTSVLYSDNEVWSVRGKLITGDEWSVFHIRVEIAEFGFVHIAINGEDGRTAAMTTGSTDSDAWHRLRGELDRHGYELD